MKVKLALLAAALQVLVLAFMGGQREWIMRTGTPLVLRTAPIDPNDPMRGAFVRLTYEISTVPAVLCRGETAKWAKGYDYRESQKIRDRVVYAAVSVNAYGLAELTSLSDTPPASGPYLRGRVESADTNGVRVRYGIEAYFMHQDAARRMETMGAEKAGAPMDVTVAVGSSGLAVLKDTSWEPLGITFAVDRRPPQPNRVPGQPWQPPPGIAGLTVTLHNYGDKDLAIVNLPDGQSFRLLANTRFNGNNYAWVGEKSDNRPAPAAKDIIVLKPGAKHDVHLDLTQSQWWVTDIRKPNAEPMPLQKVTDGWSASFRLEYSPPSADAVRGLPHADLIRHAPVRSRAFNANQGVD
ncbi:GDYXXLXY domain-containing protein [Opitutus sp. GAS368]|uniref:GDYXXLXY domain-containing protein n=1 Tax=Opitutus sp. GAS368 TaxID=1882749 RepID=UPI00087AFDE4|nr:GDYXXLXY domain-containing protein [Opitutus sp. GAS368]SDR65242.1 Uncharacterized membrane-anchored protein [Opitutus sp. GAS368]